MTQINAAQRLRTTAADSDDAAKALKFLEKIFGSEYTTSPKSSYVQQIIWTTPDKSLDACLTLDTELHTLDFYMDLACADPDMYFEVTVDDAKSFEAFKKQLARSTAKQLKAYTKEMEDVERRYSIVKGFGKLLSQLAK